MRRPNLLLPLFLLSLLAACQTADRGLQTASASPTPAYQTPDHQTPDYQTPDHQTPDYQTPDYQTPDHQTPTPTETPAPPALTELGLSSELQKLLESRQGWVFKWDLSRGAYLIIQKKWDADKAAFTSSTLGEVGYIDREGTLHFHSTAFSAKPGTESAYETDQTHSDITIPLSAADSPLPMGEGLGVRVIETQNPLFEKTGILKFTTPDGKTYVYSASSALTSEQTIDGKKLKVAEFIQMPEISQDINHPTYIPWELLHQGALQSAFLIAQGYDQPFYAYDELSENDKTLATYPKGEKFEGWRIQFQYDSKTNSKVAFLRPTNGHSQRWAMKDGKVPFFITIAPDDNNGSIPYVFTAVQIHNPTDPSHPQPDETMFLATTMGEWWADPTLRDMFALNYLSETDPTNPQNPNPDYFPAHLAPRIFIATEGGYLGKISWGLYPPRPSLDKLLGREKKIMENIYYGTYNLDFSGDFKNMELNQISVVESPIAQGDEKGNLTPLPVPYLLQETLLALGF